MLVCGDVLDGVCLSMLYISNYLVLLIRKSINWMVFRVVQQYLDILPGHTEILTSLSGLDRWFLSTCIHIVVFLGQYGCVIVMCGSNVFLYQSRTSESRVFAYINTGTWYCKLGWIGTPTKKVLSISIFPNLKIIWTVLFINCSYDF